MPNARTTQKTVVSDSDEQELLIGELEEDEPDIEVLTETAIEAKYDSNQNQIFIQRNDFLIPNIPIYSKWSKTEMCWTFRRAINGEHVGMTRKDLI